MIESELASLKQDRKATAGAGTEGKRTAAKEQEIDEMHNILSTRMMI